MQHPDEGTIHAWLDGALSAADAGAVEAHVATCATCAAAVREARGLIAASSRILSALDSVPGGVLPAVPPTEGTGAAPLTVRRSSPWRSPGWRAAAAILVVGAVSWLATRSGGPADVATERAAATAPVMEGRPGSLSDTTVVTAEPRVEQRPAAESAQRRATAPRMALRSAPAAEVSRAPSVAPRGADAERKVASREPVGVAVAAPPAVMADVASQQRDSATAVEGTRATIDAMVNRRAASAGAAASAAAEPRLAAPSRSNMMGAQPMVKAIAPASAIGAVERIAGCYVLDAAWNTSAERGGAPALLPARVELTRERLASADVVTLVLRPAPREPAFAAGTRGEWWPIGGNTFELQVRDRMTSRVSAILTIVGDSVRGQAHAYTSESAAPLVSAVKGQKVACQFP